MSHHVLYARKSTESEDRQVLSIPAQVDELRALAARRGIVVARVVEESMSAKEPGRPKFAALMREVQAGQVTGILCWKLDRLARNPIDGAAIMWALSKKKMEEVVTPSRTFTGASDDVLLMHIEFGMARKYIDDLSENVRRGLRARVARGWTPTRPPPGYLNDRNTKTVVKDPLRFPLMRRAIDLVLAGTRPSEALRVLNRVWGYQSPAPEGTAGRPVARSTFYAALANPFYAGLIRFRGDVYKGAHEPLMGHEEFTQVQRILKREGRPRYYRHEWAFAGLIRCGACAGIVSAGFCRSHTGRRYPYYHCPRYHGCHQPYARVEEVEAQVAEWLGRIRLPESVVKWYMEMIDELARDRESADRATVLNRERTRRSTERQLATLTDLRVRAVIRDEHYLKKREELLGQLTSLEHANPTPEVFEPARAVISVLNEAKNRFLAGGVSEKRSLVEAVALNPTLLDKKLLIQATKPFAILDGGGQIPVTYPHRDLNPSFVRERDAS